MLNINSNTNISGARKAGIPTLNLLAQYTQSSEGQPLVDQKGISINIPFVSGSGLDQIFDFSVLSDVRFDKSSVTYFNRNFINIYHDASNPYHYKLTDFHYRNLENELVLTNYIFARFNYIDTVIYSISSIIIYETEQELLNLAKCKSYSRLNDLDYYINEKWETRGFAIPITGVYYLPMTSLTGWTKLRSGGDPVAALTLEDLPDSSNQRLFNSTKYIRLATGANVYSANKITYTVQGGEVPSDFTNYHALIWINIEQGTGITDISNLLSLTLFLTSSLPITNTYRLAVYNTEYADQGWYGFSTTFSNATSSTGIIDFSDIVKIEINGVKNANFGPIFGIGMIAFVPKPSIAELCITCDGSYATHKDIADLLAPLGMHATFFPNSTTGTGGYLTYSNLQDIEDQGHQIGVYASGYGGNVLDTRTTIKIITDQQAILAVNGLTKGVKSFVHGVTSNNTAELNENIFPFNANNSTYAMHTLTSPYHYGYTGRYHEFAAANVSEIQSLLSSAIFDNAKMGLLIHSLSVAADWNAFADFINNDVKPLIDSGSLLVITMDESFKKNY